MPFGDISGVAYCPRLHAGSLLECGWRVRSSDPFAADAVRRSALLAQLIEQIQHGVGQCSQLRKSDPPLHLPAPEPLPTLFVTVKLINEFLVAL